MSKRRSSSWRPFNQQISRKWLLWKWMWPCRRQREYRLEDWNWWFCIYFVGIKFYWNIFIAASTRGRNGPSFFSKGAPWNFHDVYGNVELGKYLFRRMNFSHIFLKNHFSLGVHIFLKFWTNLCWRFHWNSFKVTLEVWWYRRWRWHHFLWFGWWDHASVP